MVCFVTVTIVQVLARALVSGKNQHLIALGQSTTPWRYGFKNKKNPSTPSYF